MASAKRETGEQKRQRESKHYLTDIGYEEGEQFCKNLLTAGDFGQGYLRRIAPRGMKSLPKEQLASELATKLLADPPEIDPENFVLEYCKLPRMWLCLRRGFRERNWPEHGTAVDFLSRRQKGANIHWYGPFGEEENERWYIATKNVKTHSGGVGEEPSVHWIRWQVIVQVNDDFAAMHWNNFSSRAENPDEGFKQFPYWRRIPEIFDDLAAEVGGAWGDHSPSLIDVILHGSFNRYGDDPQYYWKHKRIRSYYNTVALNASGGGGTGGDDDEEESEAERAATGLQILTEALADTAAKAVGLHHEVEACAKIERAILRKILHDWGTKSYEFILHRKVTVPPPDETDDDDDLPFPDEADDEEGPPSQKPPNNRIARMHIYFGVETPKFDDSGSIDSLQHVHCYGKYGGSTAGLKFILDEVAKLEQERGLAEEEEAEEEEDAEDFDDQDPLYDDDDRDSDDSTS